MSAAAQPVHTDTALYPKREAMPANSREAALRATADDPNHRAPTPEQLGNTVYQSELTEDGKKHLAAILGYENDDVVIRFAEDQELDLETARRVFMGLKQYLAVCVFTGGKRTPPKIVDECWHTFLLHSRDYAAFCERFTRGFVHHDPAIDDSGFSFYPKTRECAIALCGDAVDDDVWPSNHRYYVRCISTKTSEPARFMDMIKRN